MNIKQLHNEGYRAYNAGVLKTACPYKTLDKMNEWHRGWSRAELEASQQFSSIKQLKFKV